MLTSSSTKRTVCSFGMTRGVPPIWTPSLDQASCQRTEARPETSARARAWPERAGASLRAGAVPDIGIRARADQRKRLAQLAGAPAAAPSHSCGRRLARPKRRSVRRDRRWPAARRQAAQDRARARSVPLPGRPGSRDAGYTPRVPTSCPHAVSVPDSPRPSRSPSCATWWRWRSSATSDAPRRPVTSPSRRSRPGSRSSSRRSACCCSSAPGAACARPRWARSWRSARARAGGGGRRWCCHARPAPSRWRDRSGWGHPDPGAVPAALAAAGAGRGSFPELQPRPHEAITEELVERLRRATSSTPRSWRCRWTTPAWWRARCSTSRSGC